ncbi:MAG: hypothetical protein PHS24_02965 [Bacilli bacterium]|nr:hypothetical protein [Bacilli bacterium]
MKKINEIQDIMHDIQYGYLNLNNEPIQEVDSKFDEEYRLQTPKETLKYKVGVCWDQVELERVLFKGYDFKTYFILYNSNFWGPTHTFLVYEDHNNYYWFENSWFNYRGIHKYKTLNELFYDIASKHLKFHELKNLGINDINIYEYSKPKYNIRPDEYLNHCQKGKLIKINEKENINEKI